MVQKIAQGGGHVIQVDGVSLPAQANMNFKGIVAVRDNSGSSRTDVEVLGASGQGATNINADPSVYADLGNDGVLAWIHPRIVLCANGDLLVLMRYGTAHGGSNADAVLRRSTDLGVTWSAQTVLIARDYPTAGYGGGGLTVLPNGRIVHVFWKTDVNWMAIGIFSQYSDDHGVTWSAPVAFANPPGGPWDCWTLARCVLLNDGSLLAPYGKWSRDTTITECRTMRSADNGVTWADYSMVVTESEAGGYVHGWGEAQIIRLANGNLRCYLRSDKVGIGETKWENDNRWIYSSDSSDEGVTWGAVAQRHKGCSHPNHNLLANGDVSSIQRKVFSGTWRGLPVSNISKDGGTTFLPSTDEFLLDSTITKDITNPTRWIEVYSDWVEVSPGVIAAVYCFQDNLGAGATSVGVTRFKYLTYGGGVSPLGNQAANGLVIRDGNLVLVDGAKIETRDAEGTLVPPPWANTFSGLVGDRHAVNPNYQATYSADFVVFDDGMRFPLPSRTVDITVVGVNGRDAGNEAASTWYYVYAIKRPDNTINLVLSPSTAAPILPAGYTNKCLLGPIYNDASSNFLIFRQRDRQVFTYERVLTSGNASVSTLVSLAAVVPPIAKGISGYAILYSAAGSSNFHARIMPTEDAMNDYVGFYTIQHNLAGNHTRVIQPWIIGLITPQSIWYYTDNGAAMVVTIDVTGYTI